MRVDLRDTEANMLLDKLQVLNSIVDDHEVCTTKYDTILYTSAHCSSPWTSTGVPNRAEFPKGRISGIKVGELGPPLCPYHQAV